MFPSLPVFALVKSPSHPEGAAVAVYESAELYDGSKALPLFRTAQHVGQYSPTERVTALRLKNAIELTQALAEVRSDGIDKVCWNLRSDGTHDGVETIDDILRG